MYNLVIGISYSGTTPDIKSISELCDKKEIPFILCTGEKKENLEGLYNDNGMTKIVSYFNNEDITGKELSTVSMMSTLAPCLILMKTRVLVTFLKNKKL